jgi:cyclic-di-AMP phosphodiesterase PgpH
MIKISPGQQRRIYLTLLLIVSALLTLVAVLSPLLKSSLARVPQEGEIAREDYRAPIALTFTSQVLTEQRRELVERAVAPIYSSPDTRIARRQLEQLRSTLAYVNSVRADGFAPLDQKLIDLGALDDINLKPQTAETILSMTDARWQEVQQEAIAVLEKVMSSAIRPENLIDARGGVPALVTLSLPEEQAVIAAELAAAYVSPNSQYSENLTLAARQEARDAVQPVTRSFVPGQTIALQGEVLGADDVEALQQLGLTEVERNTQDLVSATILSLLLVTFTGVFLNRKRPPIFTEPRHIGVLAALMLGFLISARLILPTNPLIAYAFPLASCSLVIAALFGTETALVMTIPLSILVAFGLPNSLELTFFFMISCLFGALVLGHARRLITFFWAGLAVAISGIVVLMVFRLPQPSTNLQTLLMIGAAAFFNGLVSASLSILLHAVLAPLLGMLTPVQLLDLTRPDHPLLGLLLRDAPGTYQHSLQVANLAEQAAERINIDPLLIRAGALYHDIGKASNPVFFIENQPPGFENPHNSLEPAESARVIISHVPDGLRLARRYRLARRIMDFIAEHHGTTITNYQYFNAVKMVGGDESLVDKEPYRYPGPRPQSKETGVLMLADACEARVRAERPTEEETLHALIKNVISGRVSSGQLDETQLTLRDLNELAHSFTTTLRGIYHPRINYPNQDTQVSPDAITIPIRKKVDASSEADLR